MVTGQENMVVDIS